MAIEAVEKTLRNIAEGGIHDQLGGGFHRYSVDERWQIPHFEKMLYDNALIIRVYFDAYRITKDQFFKNIAEKSLNYQRRILKESLRMEEKSSSQSVWRGRNRSGTQRL